MTKRHAILCVAAVLASCGAVPSRADVPPAAPQTGAARQVWFHQVPRVARPPVVDGKMDDPCWKDLPVLSNFGRDRFSMRSSHPLIPMSARFGFDDTYLYCLFVIPNPDGQNAVDFAALAAKQRERMHDTAMYWNPPSLEVRIDGRRDRLGETMIQMNLVGQKEALQKIATGWSTEYSEGWEVWGDYAYAAGFDASAWWAELRVSLKDMGAEPRAGYAMGAQFRYFHPKAYFAWTPAGYDVGSYGDLLLVEKPLPPEKALALLFPDYRSMTIHMPQPDRVVVVARGRFSDASYRETAAGETAAVLRRRDALLKSVDARPELDRKAVLAPVEKAMAALDAEARPADGFGAADMMRIRPLIDAALYALGEAESRVAIAELLGR